MTCSCMDMHHESYMHIMIMSYDDESLGRGFRKRGAEGTEARGEAQEEARAKARVRGL